MAKDKKKKENKVTSYGTAKVFRYNAGVDAVVDGNTVQMAFLREYKGEVQTAMEYVWYSNENGQLVKRGLFVSGHGESGVPTLREYDVYVALQRIFINKKTIHGICELKTENIDEDYLVINFTITELAKELGYSTPNKETRESLKQSIRILLATTLFSKYAGGIYDIRNKKYIASAEIGIHLLESMQSLDVSSENDEVELDVTKIRLSKFTYEQILNDYKLFYNKQIYNKTKNLMARKIYHMALQWRGNNNFSFANINTLAERIPMVNVEDKYKKRDIKKALKILNDKGMIKIKYDDINPDKVYFIFDASMNENELALTCIDKYNSYSEIKEAYLNLGFGLDEMDEYLDVENIRYIQALLRYMDDRMRNNSIKYPKKYLKTCIKNPLKKLDQKYYNKI